MITPLRPGTPIAQCGSIGTWVDPAYSNVSSSTTSDAASAASTSPNASATCLLTLPRLAKELTLCGSSSCASASSIVSTAGSTS